MEQELGERSGCTDAAVAVAERRKGDGRGWRGSRWGGTWGCWVLVGVVVGYWAAGGFVERASFACTTEGLVRSTEEVAVAAEVVVVAVVAGSSMAQNPAGDAGLVVETSAAAAAAVEERCSV